MNTEQALISLNAMAAEFKMGVVPDDFVIETIDAILSGINLENKDKIRRELLSYWLIK